VALDSRSCPILPAVDEKWRALAREGASAAEHIAFGATVLGRASYAETACYTQAFFSLSVGFERSAKLALVVDHALSKDGAFPASETLKSYGHRLHDLLALTEQIVVRRGIEISRPTSAIHGGIIDTLSEFATNVTRYYNLELLAGDGKVATRDDPIAAWYRRVTEPILALHYKAQVREKHEREARALEALIGDFTSVRHQSETGEVIDSVYKGSALSAANRAAKPWERMYVLQIARFVGAALGELAHAAHVAELEVPAFVEMFGLFNNDDALFRNRKTWSIYARA
jgi:hypothetical protein